MENIRWLLANTENPSVQGMLSGIVEGNIEYLAYFSDKFLPSSQAQHNSALIYIPPKIWLFFGAGDDKTFNSKCKTVIREVAAGENLVSKGYYKMFFDSDTWIPAITGQILTAISEPLLERRLSYHWVINKDTILPGRDFHSDNISLQVISGEKLGEMTKWENWEVVEKELLENWPSLDAFIEKCGIGILAVNTQLEIIGWILSEFQSSRTLGIGIEVSPNFRKKGVATALGKYFIEHVKFLAKSLGQRIEVIWDAWHFNAASIKVAERIGFSRKTEYSVLYGFFDPIAHHIEQVYYWRDHHKYQEACATLEKLMQFEQVQDDEPLFFLAARTFALAGNYPQSLRHLQRALELHSENRCSFKEKIKEHPELENLRERKEFSELLDRY